MKLGPESRRVVGDNYEQIIVQILKDFGWQLAHQKFDTPVPQETRISGLQGGDALFVYFDPLLNYDIGIYVESKKCKDMTLFRRSLGQWLENLNSMVHNLDTQLFTLPLHAQSRSSHVRVQEGLLSVWIDENFNPLEFQSVIKEELSNLTGKLSSVSDFSLVTVFGNNKLLQLQAVIQNLFALIGKLQLSGEYEFMFPKAGPEHSPNTMMLVGDYLFMRATDKNLEGKFHLLAFHLGEASVHQIKHFTSSLIDRVGPLIKKSQSVHAFAWDYPASDPQKTGLWNTLFREELEGKYRLPNGTVFVQGFNPEYLNLSD